MKRYPQMASVFVFIFGIFASMQSLVAETTTWVSSEAKPGDFPLVRDGVVVPIRYSAEDFKVVGIAAQDLAADVERVAGLKPVVIAASGDGTTKGKVAPHAVWIGTLGHSPLID